MLIIRRKFKDLMARFKLGFYRYLEESCSEILKEWVQIYRIIQKLLHKIEEKEKVMLFICCYSLLTGIESKIEDFPNNLSNEIITFGPMKEFYRGIEKNGLPIYYEETEEDFHTFIIKKGVVLAGDFLTFPRKYKKYFISH